MVSRLVIRTGRQPHEVLILLAALAIGAVGSVKPNGISHAVARTFQPPWGALFYGTMFLFSLITLASIFIPRRIDGLLAERIGMGVLGVYFAGYAVAVIASTGLSGLISAVLPTAFAVGNVCRFVQIKKDLHLLQTYIREHPTDRVWIGEMLDERE